MSRFVNRTFSIIITVALAVSATVFFGWLIIIMFLDYNSGGNMEFETHTFETYTNTSSGYEIQYPYSWVVEPERAIVDSPNAILSEVYMHAPDESMSLRIRVNKNEWMLRREAPKTQTVTSAGKEQTAYLFPEGYECNLGETGSTYDCAFFVVVIPHGEVWYELWARGDATMITDVWKEIIHTFKFIDTGTQAEVHTQSATQMEPLFLFENQLPHRWMLNTSPDIISLEPKEILFIGMLLEKNDPRLPAAVVEAGSRTTMNRIGFYKLESISKSSHARAERSWFEPRAGFDYYMLCNNGDIEPDTQMSEDAVHKRWPEGKVSVKSSMPYGKRIAVTLTDCITFEVLGISSSGEIIREFQFYPD